MKHKNEDHDFKDPVCGMEVSRISATEEAVYKDKVYYFCAEICRKAFEVDPEKYVSHHRQHGMRPR